MRKKISIRCSKRNKVCFGFSVPFHYILEIAVLLLLNVVKCTGKCTTMNHLKKFKYTVEMGCNRYPLFNDLFCYEQSYWKCDVFLLEH